ncbi:C-C motif chemokine 15-like isoform X2 [Cervus canadensis]|uniref:C-C motif chemokine 15-like isoform X2 n=1 Tax=Cervus canadensis TaxID=1574408 RepID=UPI001C9E8E29|nr:C-C motif chemokine 15-like isoform X2 [Cervus canadensis]
MHAIPFLTQGLPDAETENLQEMTWYSGPRCCNLEGRAEIQGSRREPGVLRLVHRLCTRKMKTSIAALPFLILAAQAAREDMVSNLKLELSRPNLDRHSLSHGAGFHRPTDCCTSYTQRNIRCVFMEGYIDTSSACSQPAVIFVTKKGQHVCADPNNERVQKCKSELRLGSAVEDLRSLLLERGRLERGPSAPSLLPHSPHWRALA